MPALDQKRRSAAAKKAALSRSCDPDSPRLLDADRDLRAARLEDYVRRALESAPPLSEGQRVALARLLAPAHFDGAA